MPASDLALSALVLDEPLTSVQLGGGRSSGLLPGALRLEDAKADRIVKLARDNGLLINAAQQDTMRFMPALNVGREKIETCLVILSLRRLSQELRRYGCSRAYPASGQ